MAIYLLHFSYPISENHTTQHYLGYAEDVEKRVLQHQMGQSKARLIEVAVERGIGMQLVRVWEGDRALERKFKRQKNLKMFCPICTKKPRRGA